MLRYRWRSGYYQGMGEILRSAWGKPYFSTVVKMVKSEVVFLLYLMLLVCSVFTLNMDICRRCAAAVICILSYLKLLKNRSLVNGRYSAMNMTIRAAGSSKVLIIDAAIRLYRLAIKSFIVNGVDEMKILLVNKFFFIKGGAETVYFQERNWLK